MKIAFLGGRDISSIGGIENYMYNLATQLKAKGHEPIVFCESDRDCEETVNGFRVIHFKGFKSPFICKPYVGLRAIWYVVRHIKNVDVIHYNTWKPAIPGIVIAKLFRKKTILMGHGHAWQRTKYTVNQRKIIKVMELIGTSIADYRLMCSCAQTKYFKEKHNIDAVTMPTAINLPDPDAPVTSDILQKYGLEPGKYFLFLARLVKDKNPDCLIKAFNIAKPEGYKLVIAGNNPTVPDYVAMLHEIAKDNDDIVFTDAVYGDDKVALLKNALAYCIPSAIEGLSISLLEAMSYKLPVIASTIPGNEEVLEPDKAVWVASESVEDLVAAYKKIIELRGKTDSMTEYNYNKVAQQYTWDKIADRYIDTVRNFLGVTR